MTAAPPGLRKKIREGRTGILVRRAGLALSGALVLAISPALALLPTEPAPATSITGAPLLPAPSGAYPVGTRLLAFADRARSNTDSEDRPREIKVQLFYPAKAGGERAMPYLPDDGLGAAMIAAKYWAVPAEEIEGWSTRPVHASAAPPAKGGHPLILFAPGLGVSRAQYTGYAEALASHGFIVAAIDPSNLGFAIGRDGKVLTPSAASIEKAPDYARAIAEDGRYVIDALLRDRTFGRVIDPKRIGMAGHSLGGAGSLVACEEQPRLKACADLDGFPFGTETVGAFKRPILILFAKPGPAGQALDPQRIQMRDLFLGMARNGNPGSRLIFVTGVTHLSFSDFPFLLPHERMEKQGQTVASARAFEMISRALVAFFATTLGPKGEPRVEDVVTLYPELSLQP